MTATAVLDEPVTGTASIVNDCTIHVATVNGSGSQSSNSVLMRSIFQMGVPVSGKNMFPSNIAGLPTWFTIRANKDGWIARKKEVDIMICMNAATAREDVEALQPGAVCIYDAPLNCKGDPFGRHLLRGPVRETGRRAVAGLADAQAADEHDLRRHRGRPPRHRA